MLPDDRHYVWVPNGTYEMQIAFSSLDWDTDTAQIAQIRPNVDLGSDGNDDAQGQGTLVGDTIYIVLDVQPEHWNLGQNSMSQAQQYLCQLENFDRLRIHGTKGSVHFRRSTNT